MRKTLSLVALGGALALALACSGDSSTPTQPTVAATSDLQAMTAAVAPGKQQLCHRNSSEEPYGVVVEVSYADKTHKKHLNSQLDCRLNWCDPVPSGTPCDPYAGGNDVCDSCPSV